MLKVVRFVFFAVGAASAVLNGVEVFSLLQEQDMPWLAVNSAVAFAMAFVTFGLLAIGWEP